MKYNKRILESKEENPEVKAGTLMKTKQQPGRIISTQKIMETSILHGWSKVRINIVPLHTKG